MQKRVAFVTLGCKLNFSETSTFARKFEAAGYLRVSDDAVADLYVVNTCSVTEHADKKCRQTIRKLQKQNPEAIIVVAGCYAQLQPEQIAGIGGVDAVIGAEKKGELFEIADSVLRKRSTALLCSCNIADVGSIFPAYSQGERTRSFLKIQDGCNYNCSYCTIPLARGKSRNLPIPVLVAQAREIAAKGVKEIVLTGVNT
ncbi:MAG: radical SAM protein, partial [Bacteroidetes bacterium]|nr:radical SAM protein [Candidatus Egerieousia excrementavium]